MVSRFFVLMIVAIGMGGAIILTGISIFAKSISGRAANRKQVQELKRDIAEIKGSIEDIREQLADIIIRLG